MLLDKFRPVFEGLHHRRPKGLPFFVPECLADVRVGRPPLEAKQRGVAPPELPAGPAQVVIAGNHDDRELIREHFGDGGYLPADGPLCYAIEQFPVRVIALEGDTQLVFEPDQGVNTNLANAGDWVEISTTTNKFKVSSEKKILVAQYMVGQDGGFGTSDPAMLLAVSTEQFRTNYLFHAPVGWSANYVDIIAPDGATVDVDGQVVNTFTAIPGTGFSYAHVKLNNNGDGNHSVSSGQKVGISVYGVLNFGSYWYPGGLDLDLIPQ